MLITLHTSPSLTLIVWIWITQPETHKLQQVCWQLGTDLSSISRYQDAFRMACDSLLTKSLLQVVNRLDASCELQAWCKLWTADFDASCELQAWCKLWTADLMQVVNCRLDASRELQTWCKSWTADLMQVVIHRLDACTILNKKHACTILNKKRPNRLPYFGCSVSQNNKTFIYWPTCEIIFEQNSRKIRQRKVLILIIKRSLSATEIRQPTCIFFFKIVHTQSF
jgi:hypothetical protein